MSNGKWTLHSLKDLLSTDIKNGYSPVCGTEPTGKWLLSLGAVGPDGFNSNEIKPAPIQDKKLDNFVLQSGDFLVSRSNTRNRVGYSALFRGEVGNCSYPDLLMRFRVDETKIIPEYLEFFLYSDKALSYLQGSASGTNESMVKITKKILENLPVRIPSTAYQKEIVKVIQCWMKAIRITNDLIEKLERRKRGLTQALLESSTEQTILSDLCEIKKGSQLSKKDMLPDGQYYVLNGGVLPSGFTDKWNAEEETISISEGGNSCGYVNWNSERFWSGGHCYTLENIKPTIDKKFLFQVLKFNESKIMKLRVGSGLPNIQKSALSDFNLKIPKDIKLQNKIALILFEADKEISSYKRYSLLLKNMKKTLFEDFIEKSLSLES